MAKMRKNQKRITVISGHYGSGKTEFAVSLTMLLADGKEHPYKRLALIDMDVANPYFRSRERRDILESAGIGVYGSAYSGEITAELPALGAGIRAPLEDEDCRVIVDLGGNDSGALVLNQFGKYFKSGDHEHLLVVNRNRPETRDIDGALEHIAAIEGVLGIPVDGLVNNCHLLRETTAETVKAGHDFCMELAKITGKELWCDCYPAPLMKEEDVAGIGEYLMPLGLYMRPEWLDK